MNPSVDIIVVNWNSGGHLLKCVQTVETARGNGFELHQVTVVDNASSDHSTDRLESLELPLQLISNSSNRGFGAACNQGAKASSAEYLLFLNPDVRLQPDSLRVAIEFMEDPQNAKIGICGIRLLDDHGHMAQTCSRFPSPTLFFSWMLGLNQLFPKRFRGLFLAEDEIRESRTVDQVMGAFFTVRRSVFEALGGFDQRFFVYFEDLDFSQRALVAGWASYYLATTTAYHTGHGSSSQAKAARLFYWLRSRVLYGYKHFGRIAGTLLLVGTIVIEPISRLVLAVSHWSLQEVRETLRGWAMFLWAIPSLIKTQGRA